MKYIPFYQLLNELFIDGHQHNLFPDGKVWSDALPKYPIEIIEKNYALWKIEQTEDLQSFIKAHFEFKTAANTDFQSDTSMTVAEHISRLWPYLQRNADQYIEGSSLIPLAHPYIVPGGRFNEIYYWDSYFTMLGLVLDNRIEIVESMVDNFSQLIDDYGFIPNGNRTYFTSRSQPPFFSLMVTLLGKRIGQLGKTLIKYLPQLLIEYHFWMSEHRVVDLSNGQLNRYWDDDANPRAEMYMDDIHLARNVENKSHLYLNIKSACESGWDFSSRWFADENLESIETTSIIPVDLNCLLFHLEKVIAEAYVCLNEDALAAQYTELAMRRSQLINAYCYDKTNGYYADYHLAKSTSTTKLTAACMYPLFIGIAEIENAHTTVQNVLNKLFKKGGIMTTDQYTGQQWDAPNGWAPLQWIAIKGLYNYGFKDEAKRIAQRWIALNDGVFQANGKMLEKYNVLDTDIIGGGGEYPVQDGFGWTNGVYLALHHFLINDELI